MVLGVVGVAKLMRFIPRSVMVGFVNSLAILIFIAQLPHLIGVPWLVYPLMAVGILIMVIMPRLTKVVPAPLVAIVLLTMTVNVPTVGDQMTAKLVDDVTDTHSRGRKPRRRG